MIIRNCLGKSRQKKRAYLLVTKENLLKISINISWESENFFLPSVLDNHEKPRTTKKEEDVFPFEFFSFEDMRP